MSITVAQAASWGGVALGADDAISSVDIANQAGSHLVNSHEWRWMQMRSARVTPRASFSTTIGSDANTGTFLTFSTFPDPPPAYTWVVGDKIDITAEGTDAGDVIFPILGEHKIVAKLSASTIVTETPVIDIAAGSIRLSDAPVIVTLDSIGLPADFRSLVSIAPSDQASYVKLVSIDRLDELRTDNTSSSAVFYVAVNYASHKKTAYKPTALPIAYVAAQPPIPILEFWPTGGTAYLTIFYRSGWVRAVSDNDTILIPEWLEPCYIQLFQHFAQGHLEKDEMSMADRVGEWERDPITVKAKQRDGLIQRHIGMLRNGAAESVGYGHHPMDRDTFSVTF